LEFLYVLLRIKTKKDGFVLLGEFLDAKNALKKRARFIYKSGSFFWPLK